MDVVRSNNLGSGLIADLICLAILVIFAISNWKKGFISQLFRAISTIGALLLAYFLAESVVNFANESFNFSGLIAEKIQGMLGEGTAYLADLTEENLKTAIAELKLPDFIADFALQSLSNVGTGVFANIGEFLANIITHYIALTLAFIVVFIVAKILLFIVCKILEKIVKLPLIRLVDKTLGLLWGLIKAVIFLFVIIFIIEIMPGEAFAAAKTALNDSLFASFLQNYNVFTIAMNWIATKLNLSI